MNQDPHPQPLIALPRLARWDTLAVGWAAYWPGISAALIAWAAFIALGNTPVIRATGMALAVAAISMTLRRLDGALALTGGLVLAFSPAFWSQTGGAPGRFPDTLALALVLAAVIVIVLVALSRRPYVVGAVALGVVAALFITQIGEARSLRVTVMGSAWLIYLLFTAVLETNPRPDGPPPAQLKAQYRAGLLGLLVIGVINDPLFALFVPAVALGLSQAKTRLPWWYWATLGTVLLVGVYGILDQYVVARWWSADAFALHSSGRAVPYLVAAAWQEPLRWLDLFSLLAAQFTLMGVLLGIIGLARLSRWYPVLGEVTLLGIACFFGFGLAYFGADRAVLLLPLFMLQVIAITYAVYVLGQWLQKALQPARGGALRWLMPAAYLLLPTLMLLNILGAAA